MKLRDKEYDDNKYLLDQIKDDNIRKRIDQSFKWYNDRAVSSKKSYYAFSLFTIVCPAASTVVLLLSSGGGAVDPVKVISGILMAVSSCMAAFITLFDVRNKWGIYRNQSEQIKSLLAQHLIDDKKDEKELLREIEQSMTASHKEWQKCFDKNAPQKDKQLQ